RRRTGARRGGAAGGGGVALVLPGRPLPSLAIKAERDRARRAEAERTRQLYDALVARAEASRLAGRIGARAEALAALEEAARLAPGLDLGPDRVLELRNELIAATTMPDIRIEKEWEGHPVGTRAVAFDAELRRYARCE